MALKLDINKDTLIPSKAFQDWANDFLTERGIRTSVEIPLIGELFKRDKDLQGKLQELKTKIDQCPQGSDIWFSKMFLWPFGGKVTSAAKTYFEELERKGRIRKLEEGAREAAAARQTNGTKLDAACAFALDLLENPNEGLPAAVGALGNALSSTPAAAPAAAAAAASAASESFIRSFDLSKRLYEAGFITRSEYTAKLLETKRLLKEANEPVKPPLLTGTPKANEPVKPPLLTGTPKANAPTPIPTTTTGATMIDNRAGAQGTDAEKTAAIAANKARFGGFVSSINVNCTTLDTGLKGLQTLGKNLAKQPALSESVRRQVIKSHIKKRILQEMAGKDSREQLNEFFLITALLAALTGAIAWAAAKIGDFFKGSEYSRSSPTYSSPSTPEQIAKAAADLGSSLTAAYGPDGMLVDASGRRVIGEIQVKTAYIKALDGNVEAIRLSMVSFAEIEKGASPNAGATDATELAAYLGVTDQTKIRAAGAALAILDKYKNADTIKKAVEDVKTALKAV